MIKLKDILFEVKRPSIFVPRRMEDRVERMIKNYIRNGSKGDINLSGSEGNELRKFPEIMKGITVDGNFYCYFNKLTTLENSPRIVTGYFNCTNNQLTSLKGAPERVGFFDCCNNKLTSLEGAPEIAFGGFACRFNKKEFTEEDVEAVCNVNGRIYI